MMPPRKRRLLLWLAAFLLLALAGVDAVFIEPFWIEVTRHEVRAPVASPVKIAHLTDLHTSGLQRRERRMLEYLELEKPDLIVITGDTVMSDSPRAPAYDMAGEVLSRLRAPLGVWAVRGNWENTRRRFREQRFYSSLGVKMLVNDARPARPDLWIMGFDDLISGRPSLDPAILDAPPGAARIALFHSPALFDSVAGRCDLAFAGHTHGGQVRIPFLPALWLPPGCRPYESGWYERAGSRMYVSRGLGMSLLDIRFFCRPELAFITVR